MKIGIRNPFYTQKDRDVEKRIELALNEFESLVLKRSKEFETQVRKAMHGAHAGIICDSCGKDVFRSEANGWVHGNGGKAYCMDPCWKSLQGNKEKK